MPERADLGVTLDRFPYWDADALNIALPPAGSRLWRDGLLGGPGGGVSGDFGAALLVPQDRQCDKRAAGLAAAQGEGGAAGVLDDGHVSRCPSGGRPVRGDLPGQVPEGGGETGQGS